MELIDNDKLREADAQDREEAIQRFDGMEITFDANLNVVTKWEKAAVTRGIPTEVRNYLKERLACALLDAGKAPTDPIRQSLQGRAKELQELLGLFKV